MPTSTSPTQQAAATEFDDILYEVEEKIGRAHV